MTNPTPMTETMSNMFRQAGETFQSAMETSCKMQQDALEACTKPMCNDEMVADVRERTNRIMDGGMKTMQKTFEDTHKFFDTAARTNMDLCRKVFDAARPAERNDLFETTRNMWQSTFDAMRSTVEQFTKCQMTGFENWSHFMNHTMACNGKGEMKKPVAAK